MNLWCKKAVSREEINRQQQQAGFTAPDRRGGQPARQEVSGMVGNMQHMMARMNQMQQGHINNDVVNSVQVKMTIAII